MVKLVWDLKNEMENEEISNFGEILNENWNLKKTLSNNISNDAIDQIYDEAISCGATGGKLLGAGGGGFMILLPEMKMFELSCEIASQNYVKLS